MRAAEGQRGNREGEQEVQPLKHLCPLETLPKGARCFPRSGNTEHETSVGMSREKRGGTQWNSIITTAGKEKNRKQQRKMILLQRQASNQQISTGAWEAACRTRNPSRLDMSVDLNQSVAPSQQLTCPGPHLGGNGCGA